MHFFPHVGGKKKYLQIKNSLNTPDSWQTIIKKHFQLSKRNFDHQLNSYFKLILPFPPENS